MSKMLNYGARHHHIQPLHEKKTYTQRKMGRLSAAAYPVFTYVLGFPFWWKEKLFVLKCVNDFCGFSGLCLSKVLGLRYSLIVFF